MEPEVLAELVEQHEPEVPVISGPDLPAAAVEAATAAASAGTAGDAGTAAAGTAGAAGGEDECCCRKNGDNLPLLVLHLQVLALHVERAVNQMVEVVEAVVEQRVLEVVLKALHEVLLLLAVMRNIGRGVASELKETVMVLRHRHSPLK